MTTLDERHGEHREGAHDGGLPRGGGTPDPHVVSLTQATASLPLLTGSKAAHLARAARAGLPVLPGFVLPYGSHTAASPVQRAWRELSGHGSRPLVVRSSSPQEDTRESSLAGRFDSVLEVRGWEEFRAAVHTVRESAEQVDGVAAPMAVLVQPMLRARVGGVLFGADPVAGRTDRMLVSAVRGGPDSLVSGEQPGTSHVLSGWGRLLRTEPAESGEPAEPLGPQPAGSERQPAGSSPLLTASELRRLARLARRAARVFGGPQDIEFGFDEDGRLWLFQSRPITAMAARPGRGARLLGPGPVAETLPGQLEPLEEDLWVAPMARGLAVALDIGGSAPRRLLRTVPVVTTVGGRAAADLRLMGTVPPRHRWLALLNPAPGARRLGASWRVGRLASTLPDLATDLVADVDRRLTETPPPGELPTAELISTLRWTRAVLVSLHAQEALAGAFLPEPHVTAASTALATLAETGAQHLPDHRLIAAEPVVLALMAPSLWATLRLPRPNGAVRHDHAAAASGVERTASPGAEHTASPTATDAPTSPAATSATATATAIAIATAAKRPPVQEPGPHAPAPVPGPIPPPAALPPREALRLRVRWVQELQVRLVREGARRLVVRGALREDRQTGLLRWKEFVVALESGPLPRDLDERLPRSASAPLPDAFRLAGGGVVVAERTARRSGDGARGVSGGRAVGTAWDGVGPRPPDAVLVVRTLDPALAPLLPRLSGLVAQTGSPLSHLAVLAREFGVPTVVGATDAVRRFPPGTRLTVDGTSGDVRSEGSP
ncbi:PEP/pyruvate-binding domain-containing protein [Streptomyces ipomoeae]|uniref:PEP/pyruvate-binding domain-containing protein n=1 Tax=Streptomyces ipomoeae TaxID=103232 RepID=UPI001147335E|nr:PEP/pyruvate-binding domain-containing protein [Streptomyces ipomoeae]MDX2931028.1 PEP/pyruvate-binding domain-containing protein [Streptomyces ipomoeae]TQE14640.1 pyruvate phosphate dikinase [Streptomyces ipomoeae]